MRARRATRRLVRTFAVVAALALTLPALPAVADHPPGSVPAYGWACDGSAPEDGFHDVDAANVHEPAIDCAVAHGLVAGTSPTTYSPLTAVTRAQLATFVSRLLPTDELTGERPPPDAFDDDNSSVHEAAIDRLAALGVVRGTGPRTYSPDATVTRAQLASYLVRAWEHRSRLRLPWARDRFADDDESTHERAIDQLAAMSITTGVTPTTYSPSTTVRRDQMARFLVSAFGCTQWWWPRDGQHHSAECDSYTETDGLAALQGFEVTVVTDAQHYTAGQPVEVEIRACNWRSTELRQFFPQRDWFALEARNTDEVRPESAPPDHPWYHHRWPHTLEGAGYSARSPDAVWQRISGGRPALAGVTWFDGPQSGPDEVVVWQAGECKMLDVGAWRQADRDTFTDGSADFPAQWPTSPAGIERTRPGWHMLRLSWGGVEVGHARRYLSVDSDGFHLDGPRVTAAFDDRTYAPGEPVPVTVSACNTSDEVYTEYVGRRDTSGEVEVFQLVVRGGYDGSSSDVGSVWVSGTDRELVWGPGECKSWELTWDQRLGDREPVEFEPVQPRASWNPHSDTRPQQADGDGRAFR